LYRNFIILQEDERGYSSSNDKTLSGYSKIEAKGDKCKISFYAQNLRNDSDDYHALAVCNKKDNKKLLDLGNVMVSDGGKVELTKEYSIDDIGGNGLSYDKISGVAIAKMKNDVPIIIMCGFINGEQPKDNWKSYKIEKGSYGKDKDNKKKDNKKKKDKRSDEDLVLNESLSGIKENIANKADERKKTKTYDTENGDNLNSKKDTNIQEIRTELKGHNGLTPGGAVFTGITQGGTMPFGVTPTEANTNVSGVTGITMDVQSEFNEFIESVGGKITDTNQDGTMDTVCIPYDTMLDVIAPTGTMPTGIMTNISGVTGSVFTGTMQGGTMQGGTMQGGTMQGGTMQGGTMQGGTMQGGTMQGGTMQGGTMQGGTMQGGAMQGGTTQSGAMPFGTTPTGTVTNMNAPFETMPSSNTPGMAFPSTNMQNGHMPMPYGYNHRGEDNLDNPFSGDTSYENPFGSIENLETPFYDKRNTNYQYDEVNYNENLLSGNRRMEWHNNNSSNDDIPFYASGNLRSQFNTDDGNPFGNKSYEENPFNNREKVNNFSNEDNTDINQESYRLNRTRLATASKPRSKFDEYEEKIDKLSSTFKIRGSVGEYFESIANNFDVLKDELREIKYCKWYEVKVNDLNDLCNMSNYNRYTVAYYPMLNYYPYIRKHSRFLLGYKCDKDGNLKYIVYGVPGEKNIDDQPYEGKTGFVTWVKDENRDGMGYWLMFYDFRNSIVVVPME
jgi:hypothetical protein